MKGNLGTQPEGGCCAGEVSLVMSPDEMLGIIQGPKSKVDYPLGSSVKI